MPCYLELRRLQGRRKVSERGVGPRTGEAGGEGTQKPGKEGQGCILSFCYISGFRKSWSLALQQRTGLSVVRLGS